MPRCPALLSRLRRSVLGAWLACAYALAVLAAALAPAPAHAFLPDAVLCSGLALPGEPAPAPGGDGGHCKGCPAGPPAVLPDAAGMPIAAPWRSGTIEPSCIPTSAGAHRPGLPQPRGPPRA